MGKFLDFILSRDKLGHGLSVNYKGSDSHPTKLGALLSIGIQLMAMIYFV